MSDLTTPLPPPPRRLSGSAVDGKGCGRWLFLPFAVAGLALLVIISVRLAVQYVGRPIVATIDELKIDSRGRQTYVASFHYDLDGRRSDDRQQVTGDEFRRLHRGDRVAGRVASAFGWRFALTRAGNPLHMTGLMAAVAVPFVAVAAGMARGAWGGGPAGIRDLVATGTAVAGQVTAAYRARRTSPVLTVTYRFAGPAGWVTGRQLVTDGGTAIAVGQAVTVVFDPARPRRNTVYEWSGFRALP